jgi:predicted transcriptional regulator
MQTIERVRLTVMADPQLDMDLRKLALKHRKSLSEVANEALRYCLENRNFLNKLDDKYSKPVAEAEIEY